MNDYYTEQLLKLDPDGIIKVKFYSYGSSAMTKIMDLNAESIAAIRKYLDAVEASL